MTTVPPPRLPAYPVAGLADELSGAAWRTSTRSQTSNCVEVAPLCGRTTSHCAPAAVAAVAVRDSKDRRGPVLVFARRQWLTFLTATKKGEFDINL
jgi:hypothetical protein